MVLFFFFRIEPAFGRGKPLPYGSAVPKARRDLTGVRERGAEVVAPYAGCGADSPGIGGQVGTFCWVVEDADPYDEAFPVGRDAHIAPGHCLYAAFVIE